MRERERERGRFDLDIISTLWARRSREEIEKGWN